MKLFGSTQQLIDKATDGEKAKSLEMSLKTFLFQCYLVHNLYQQKSEVLHIFTSNKCYAVIWGMRGI